jgi:dihydroorotate dehydrogenase electron transfer subunit
VNGAPAVVDHLFIGMMQTRALVTDVEQSGPFTRVVFEAPGVTDGLSAGRFVLADLGSYLRALLFPAFVDSEVFWALVPPGHPAAALRPGADVDLIGPLGRGFEVDAAVRRLLLVADVACLPVLLPLVRQNPDLSERPGFSVALLLSALTAAELYPVRLLPPDLEVHIVTADGSAGRRGSALGLFPDLVRWADCVCVACDSATYPALAEVVREVRMGSGQGFAQAMVAPNASAGCTIACGVGACQGCAVPVVDGFKLACVDGPVFDLLELR